MALDPQYTTTPRIASATLTAANNVYDGTGTVGTCFTAGANGSFVGFVKLKPKATNAVSVARFWINNGATNATATNNFFWGEVTLPATTTSAVAALTELTIQFNIAIPAGYTIIWSLGTVVVGGWQATAVGGDY